MWRPGDAVVWRTVRSGVVRYAFPHVAVADEEDLVALYLRAGTGIKAPVDGEGRHVRGNPARETGIGDLVWERTDVLRLTPPAAAHSVDVFWDAGSGDLRGWYVNLQEPLRRTPIGFDTRDHVLDIWVEPGGRWRWKDEHELDERVRSGTFTPAEADAVRAEGERVIARIEAWAPPFCDGWERWRPDPGWPLPELPDTWSVL